jgi:urea transport system permease protein
VLVNYAKTYLTAAFPEVWLYALGALFVLVTLFLPRGVIGLIPARDKSRSDGRGSGRIDERTEMPDSRGVSTQSLNAKK